MTKTFNAFKFRTVNKFLIESLVKSNIYFSSPKALNDPFDCRVDILESFERSIQESDAASREKLEKVRPELTKYLKRLEKDIPDLGVFSFSAELLNPVMWSHYADRHRGVCLYYEFSDSILNYPTNFVIGRSPVTYGDDPIADWFRQNALDLGADLDDELLIELTQRVLTVKSKHWSYEFEARLIASRHGSLEIDPSCLKRVCFGLATPNDDIDLVKQILESKYPTVRFARIESDGTDFGITANDI